jgi:hypothetical protein
MLTLKFKDNVLGEFRLEKGKSLSIGREETNDIPIENRAISKHHAKIESIGDGFLLSDLESKNGTFVNRRPVSSQWLQHGDAIRVGKHTLLFEYDENELPPDVTDGACLQPGPPPQRLTPEIDVVAIAQEPAETPATSLTTLRFIDGGKGLLTLGKHPVTLGRDPGCDVTVSGMTIGKLAAVIHRDESGYLLSYRGGLTKPKLNNRIVSTEARLNDMDVIILGPVKLQFVSGS